MTKITDINSDFLTSGNVLNLFFLLNNETQHAEKIKLVKLIEQTATPDMFRQRVFNELIHEIFFKAL